MQSIPEFSEKIGRNDPCPCGSKKKFKKCHGHHTDAPDASIFEIGAKTRSISRKGECMAPECLHDECSKGVISSHTVSKSGSLGAIQREGHVYSYNLTLTALHKSHGGLKPESTGWKQASTFPGFCGYHDKQIFSLLEDNPFTGSKEQCFLIAYRSVAKELHAKINSARQNKLRAAYAKSKKIRKQVSDFNKGVDLGVRDVQRHKAKYDHVLINKNWDKVHGLLIEFDGTFPIQCTGGLLPDEDINGLPIQKLDWRDATPDCINLASYAAGGKSYFLICWLNDSDISGSLFSNPIENYNREELPAVIGTLILQRTENCHFSPDWYDGLTQEEKNWCEANGLSGVFWGDLPPPALSANQRIFRDIKIANITKF